MGGWGGWGGGERRDHAEGPPGTTDAVAETGRQAVLRVRQEAIQGSKQDRNHPWQLSCMQIKYLV